MTVVRTDICKLPKNKRKEQTLLIFVQAISALESARRIKRNYRFILKDTAIDIEMIIIKSPE